MSSSGTTKVNAPVCQASRRFHRYVSGEVIRGEFRGDPCIAVHCPVSKAGGMVVLNGSRLNADFDQFWGEVRSAFAEHVSTLQIKVLALRADEASLRELLTKRGLQPTAFALFSEEEKQEVFFFSENGRLRAAPLQISSSAVKSGATTPVSEKKAVVHRMEPHPTSQRKARVLIVDDSKTMRQLLRRILDSAPDLEVVGEAERPSQVESLIHQCKPDVMTLDINMPEMTGVELLRKLLPKHFIPTVMISSLSIDEGKEVLTALELGAVDYIHKPSAQEMATMMPLIQEKVLEASRVKRRSASPAPVQQRALGRVSGSFSSSRFIAVGASTGGTEAIKNVFMGFPADIPPVAVVQHIPPYFSTAFANRLNELCPFEVREAKDGDEFLPGLVLIAPGGRHMEVVREGSKLIAKVYDGEPVNRFKPSVDVLFNSVAKLLGGKATGVLMTGMGSDGAKGLLAMKNAGSFTIAQDQESCVVFGMPRAAIEIGAACEIRSLEEIATALMKVKAA